MNKEKYDLAYAIHMLFVQDLSIEMKQAIFEKISEQTGLSTKDLNECICQDQTIGQAKYRILGLMDKRKINSSHII